MEFNLTDLELNTLRKMHDKEAAALNARLLEGAMWHEVRDQKEKLTQISIAIYKKIRALKDPSGDPGLSAPEDMN